MRGQETKSAVSLWQALKKEIINTQPNFPKWHHHLEIKIKAAPKSFEFIMTSHYRSLFCNDSSCNERRLFENSWGQLSNRGRGISNQISFHALGGHIFTWPFELRAYFLTLTMMPHACKPSFEWKEKEFNEPRSNYSFYLCGHKVQSSFWN